jgi:hypothetical protein
VPETQVVRLVVLLLCKRNLTMFKEQLERVRNDSLFYLVYSEDLTWYKVITLKSGQSVSKLEFVPGSLRATEDYDLQGLTLRSISLQWKPYLVIEDCDAFGQRCKNSGYLKVNRVARLGPFGKLFNCFLH